jgi:hypothetical protein
VEPAPLTVAGSLPDELELELLVLLLPQAATPSASTAAVDAASALVEFTGLIPLLRLVA